MSKRDIYLVKETYALAKETWNNIPKDQEECFSPVIWARVIGAVAGLQI